MLRVISRYRYSFYVGLFVLFTIITYFMPLDMFTAELLTVNGFFYKKIFYALLCAGFSYYISFLIFPRIVVYIKVPKLKEASDISLYCDGRKIPLSFDTRDSTLSFFGTSFQVSRQSLQEIHLVYQDRVETREANTYDKRVCQKNIFIEKESPGGEN